MLMDVFTTDILQSLSQNLIFITLMGNDNLLVYASNANTNAINAKSITELLKTEFNVKGGGSPTVAQISVKSIGNPLKIIFKLLESM